MVRLIVLLFIVTGLLTSIRQQRGQRPGPLLGGGQQHRPAALQHGLGSGLHRVEHAGVAGQHHHRLLEVVEENAAQPQAQLLRVHLVADGCVELGGKNKYIFRRIQAKAATSTGSTWGCPPGAWAGSAWPPPCTPSPEEAASPSRRPCPRWPGAGAGPTARRSWSRHPPRRALAARRTTPSRRTRRSSKGNKQTKEFVTSQSLQIRVCSVSAVQFKDFSRCFMVSFLTFPAPKFDQNNKWTKKKSNKNYFKKIIIHYYMIFFAVNHFFVTISTFYRKEKKLKFRKIVCFEMSLSHTLYTWLVWEQNTN